MSIWSWAVSHNRGTIGWDLGGAHLKLAIFDGSWRLRHVAQIPMPLWQGIDHLEAAFAAVGRDWPLADYEHVLTMTGELVDLFESRNHGVCELAHKAAEILPKGRLRLYAGPAGYVSPTGVESYAAQIASANWYATTDWLAQQLSNGVMIDIGSTTTDLLPFSEGRVGSRGYSDRERLICDEMIYSGVVRTPVMAVVQRVPFANDWQLVANEHFATMADVYRILGWLPEGADQHPSADGNAKSAQASRRRLARMLGTDAAAGREADWMNLAGFVADRQMDTISLSLQRLLSGGLPADAPLVGAGVGRFLAERIAGRLGRSFVDIDQCFAMLGSHGLAAAVCAPAVAVALLARREEALCAC
jgi:probable H4MPT-linked C1 transfer pathway protein